MATILKRTAFYEVVKDKDGKTYFLPHDWALVNTTLGVMAEPFNFNQKFRVGAVTDYAAFAMDEEMIMVNDLLQLDSNINVLGETTNGGRQAPRDGR